MAHQQQQQHTLIGIPNNVFSVRHIVHVRLIWDVMFWLAHQHILNIIMLVTLAPLAAKHAHLETLIKTILVQSVLQDINY